MMKDWVAFRFHLHHLIRIGMRMRGFGMRNTIKNNHDYAFFVFAFEKRLKEYLHFASVSTNKVVGECDIYLERGIQRNRESWLELRQPFTLMELELVYPQYFC